MCKVDVTKPFGTSVKFWRERLGISQEELGERAGLHRTYISDVERGERNVSLESITKLAHALEISVPLLLSEIGEINQGMSDVPADVHTLVEILLVEDNADDVELTLHALKRAQIRNKVHIVGDGAAALDFVFAACAPDRRKRASRVENLLMLLDLDLPKVRGVEVLKRLKSDVRTSSIPVVVLTASQRDRDFAVSKQLGADGYIVKPVEVHTLSEITPQLRMSWALLIHSSTRLPGKEVI